MVFDALKGAPGVRIIGRRIKGIADASEIDGTGRAAGGFRNDLANGIAQAITVAGIESHAGRRRQDREFAHIAPIFRDMNRLRL